MGIGDGMIVKMFHLGRAVITYRNMFSAFAAAVWCPAAVSSGLSPAGLEDGDRLVVAQTNVDGKVTGLARVRVEKRIGSILEAPIGATYLMTEAERAEMENGTSKEMIFPVPLDRTATAPQYWMRPLRVVVERTTNVAVGFFSVSRRFDTRQEARAYLADSIGPELTRHFGREPMLTPCGKAEFRFPYVKDGDARELRFKFFSVDGGEKSVIMIYHGRARPSGSMEREFAAIHADLVGK